MEIVDAFGLAGAAFLVKKIIDWFRQLRGGEVNAAATQVVAWLAGVGIFWLLAASDLGNIVVAGMKIEDLNWAATTFGGLILGSTASVVTDSHKAKDDTQTAALPALFEPTPKPVGQTPTN